MARARMRGWTRKSWRGAEATRGLGERHAPRPDPPVRRRLEAHFGADPTELPVVGQSLQAWDRPNLQVALDAWLEGRGVEVSALPMMEGYRAGLVELVRGG